MSSSSIDVKLPESTYWNQSKWKLSHNCWCDKNSQFSSPPYAYVWRILHVRDICIFKFITAVIRSRRLLRWLPKNSILTISHVSFQGTEKIWDNFSYECEKHKLLPLSAEIKLNWCKSDTRLEPATNWNLLERILFLLRSVYLTDWSFKSRISIDARQ